MVGEDSSASESNSSNGIDRVTSEEAIKDIEEDAFRSSILEGLQKQKAEAKKVTKEKSSGLSLLGGYDFSDSDSSDSDS